MTPNIHVVIGPALERLTSFPQPANRVTFGGPHVLTSTEYSVGNVVFETTQNNLVLTQLKIITLKKIIIITLYSVFSYPSCRFVFAHKFFFFFFSFLFANSLSPSLMLDKQ